MENQFTSRSRLISLDPGGLGTELIENPASYITRLANNYYIPVYIFLEQLAIIRNGANKVHKNNHKNSLAALKSDVNGLLSLSDVTFQLLTSLNVLTSRNDLLFLSLSNHRDTISKNELFKKNKAWCPDCLLNFRDASPNIVYEPLLWQFREVLICHAHEKQLEELCPNCQLKQPFISSFGICGFCHFCKSWLGMTKNSQTPLHSNFEYQAWRTRAISDFLIQDFQRQQKPRKIHFYENINSLVEKHFSGNRKAFNTYIGKAFDDVYISRDNIPIKRIVFKNLLNICYTFGIKLWDVLYTEFSIPVTTINSRNLPTETFPARIKENNREDVQIKISQYLNSDEVPIPLSHLTKRLGLEKHYINNQFPLLAKAITDKYQQFTLYRLQKDIENSKDEVRKICEEQILLGQRPGYFKVRPLMTHPSHMNHPIVHAEWEKYV